jgi:hypothetical protein
VSDYSYFNVAYDSYVDYNYLKDALGHDINPTQLYTRTFITSRPHTSFEWFPLWWQSGV